MGTSQRGRFMGNAELVMADIEWHTNVVAGMEFGTTDADKAVSNAVLGHLTELHKLRDERVYLFVELRLKGLT
jgi:hypothetical protein